MSMKLLRLGLQFFAGGTKEEEDEVIIPGEEGVTGASGVTGSTPPAYTMPGNTVSAPVAQDFDTWYKANGGMDEAGYYAKYDLDPDRDYQNTVNTLNYEYQTSMANYGEQAEKMYQMGLQNSGVSDIFQANAFSAYLGNMNQAAANRITARKRNKAAFNDYVANMRAQHGQYESGINSEYDTKLNSALAFALDRYNGYNLDSVLSELGVAGYYTEIVQAVGDKLSGINATSLTALKAQTENNLAQSILTAFPNLTEADKSAVKTMFGGMVPDDALNAAFNRALTTYQNTDAGKTAAVNTFVTNWTDSFDPNEGKEAFVNKMITKEDGTLDESQRANAEAAWEQMKSNWDAAAPERVQAIVDTFGIGEGKIDPSSFESKEAFIDEMVKNNHSAEDAEAAWNRFDEAAGKAYNEVWAKYQAVDDTGALINTYTKNTKQKLDIKNLLGAEVPEYIYNEIIKRMDANLAEEKEADKQDTLTGIEDLPEDEVSYNTLYNEIQNSGNDPNIIAGSSVKYKDAVMGVLNDDSGKKLANAYKLIPNMTKQTWDALDGAGKLDALLNGMGEVHKNNVLTADDYDNIVEMWATASLEEADIHNMPNIIQMLNNFADKYGLSNETIDSIIRGANVHVRGITPHISSSSDMGAIFVDTNKGNVQIRVRRATRLTDTDKQNMVTLFDGSSYQLARHSGSNILYYLENGKYYELESNEKTEIMFPVNTVAAEIVDTNVVKGSTGYDPIKGAETNKVVLPDGSEHTIPTGYRVEKLNTGVIMAVPEDGATRERQPIVLYDPDKS